MQSETKLIKIGTSKGVILKKEILRELEVDLGSFLKVSSDEEGNIILTPFKKEVESIEY